MFPIHLQHRAHPLCFLVIVFLLCVLPILAQAKTNTTYTLCVQDYKEYMPYSRYQQGQYLGFNRELFDLFARRTGVVFEYRPMPLKRIIRKFIAGKCDLLYPDNPYWSAKLKKDVSITYSQPVIKYVDGVTVRRKNLGKDIKNLKVVGMILGFTPYGYDRYISSGQILFSENKNILGLFQQVLRNRIDGAYCNIAVSQYYIKKLAKKLNTPVHLFFDPSLPHIKSYRSLSTLKHKLLIQNFNRFLKQDQKAIHQLKINYNLQNY